MRLKQISKKLYGVTESVEASIDTVTTIVKVPIKYAVHEDGGMIIPKGIIVNENGDIVNDSTAYGVVKVDKPVPEGLVSDKIACVVIVDGVVWQHLMPTIPSKEVKEALVNIKFDACMDKRDK